MLKIDERPNQFAMTAPSGFGLHGPPRSLNAVAKKVENQRIQMADKKMHERIDKMRATSERRRREVNQKEFERQLLSARMSENSNRARVWQLPRPSRPNSNVS